MGQGEACEFFSSIWIYNANATSFVLTMSLPILEVKFFASSEFTDTSFCSNSQYDGLETVP
jgi:hypothetical protein